jgi:hypothetical protein
MLMALDRIVIVDCTGLALRHTDRPEPLGLPVREIFGISFGGGRLSAGRSFPTQVPHPQRPRALRARPTEIRGHLGDLAHKLAGE